MGQSGKFFGQLEDAFGKGNVTSGYRSQDEQNALVKQGATRATRSSHTYENGYDLAAGVGKSESDIRAGLAAKGLSAGRVLYERGGKNQGTGPHWHVELNDGSGTQVATNQAAAPNAGNFLDGLFPTLAPESKASGAVSSNAGQIFNSDAELNKRSNAVEGVLTQQGKSIDVLTGLQTALHGVQTEAMQQQANETRAISDQTVQATQELARQVAPVFQARARIADQLDKVNTMNPLERGLRGVFDLNYDQSHLESQLTHYDSTLQMRANDYDYMNKLHQAALTEIDRRYSLDTALPKLAAQQSTEDLGLLGMSLQQTSGMLGNLRDSISGQAQMIAAKASARNDMMGRVDVPTLIDLANKAKMTGGVVNFNGVDLNYHELREQIQKSEQLDLSMESMKMSIAGGRMELAEKQATNTVRYMSREQVEGAIANGGMFNGVQLPADVLTQQMAIYTQQGKDAANSVAARMPATAAMNLATQAFNGMTELTSRARGVLGTEGLGDITSISGDSSQLVQRLTQAVQGNEAPEVIQGLLQKIGAKQAALNAQVDERLLQHVGGDKRAAGYLKSFVYKTPMSQGSSAEALTYFALKGSLPNGMGLSDESKQLFKQAQGIVERVKGTKNPATGKPYSEKDLQEVVTREIATTAGGTIGAARGERILNALPATAAKAAHPFGRIDPAAFAQARQHAEVSAAQTLAPQLHTTWQTVLQMAKTGRPVDGKPESLALFKAFGAQAGAYNSHETAGFIQELDDLPQVTPGRRNSSVMQDFLQSPAMHLVASNYSDGLGSHSMGDYLVNPLANGATENYLSQATRLISSTQAALSSDSKRNARHQASAVAFDPKARVHVILSSIEGLGKPGADALRPIVGQLLTQMPQSDMRLQTGEFTNTAMQRQERFVIDSLKSTKFDDPKLEVYRKLAVKGWDQSATRQNTFIENLMDAISN